jgi:hypothetical protein
MNRKRESIRAAFKYGLYYPEEWATVRFFDRPARFPTGLLSATKSDH